MSKRLAHYSVAAHEPPLMKPKNTGWSDLAIHSSKAWDGKDRPEAWRGNVYGLVVHTTGRGLPEKAAKANQYPTVRAVNYYSKSHGCHYVCGYRGHEGGDLIQMAHEDEQANGVGTVDQRKSIQAGRWKKDLPNALVKRWQERWPGYSNPLDILPRTRSCNPAYIHLECIPLTSHFMEEHEPASQKELFTDAQYQTIAALACDIAWRNGWEGSWWRTPRLVGHEDISPLTRHTKAGGWDPGWLRASKWFDWEKVLEWITAEEGCFMSEEDFSKEPKSRKGGPYARYT